MAGAFLPSNVVIRFAFEDGVSTINLLNRKRSNHLMGKGHGAEAPFFLRELMDAWVETIRPANHPCDVFQSTYLKFF